MARSDHKNKPTKEERHKKERGMKQRKARKKPGLGATKNLKLMY